ncbi:MAG: hypothetical protein RMJ33_11005 [Saprospiraceae bacterium]|nr:hypothetical protein [Saprospiraceae bacterium]MDW8230356.1 hypothetical protein [Saprospiraceae bacterium]
MAGVFLGQEPVKHLKIRARLAVVAVGQFVLLAAALNIQVGVPAAKGQKTSSGCGQKNRVAICLHSAFAVIFVVSTLMGRSCRVDVLHHKPKLLPFLSQHFQTG